MKTTMEIDEIRDTASNLFKDMFPRNALIEVVVKPGLDWEGDKILNITFVFEETKILDPEKANELSWLVRRRIVVEEDCFPMIKFANTEDAKVMKIGTAA